MRLAKHASSLLIIVGFVGLLVATTSAQNEARKQAPPKALPAQPSAQPAPRGTPPQVTPGQPVAPPAGQRAARPEDAAEAALRKAAEAFVVAYEAKDAKAIAAGFTADGEFVDEEGQTIRGREAIEQHFAVLFREMPKARIKIDVQSIRLVAPDVAVEEGRVESRPSPDDRPEVSQYVALSVKQGDRWLVARTRDFQAGPAHATGHERLQPLAWLVGEWVDESPDVVLHTSCKWADSKNYLLQEFTAHIRGRPLVNGSTRIGWDPLTKQIKSWTFDSNGSYSEALWTGNGNEWVQKARGVTTDGEVSSATNVIKRVDASTLTWESRDRIVGEERTDDIVPIVVKRRAPPPASP